MLLCECESCANPWESDKHEVNRRNENEKGNIVAESGNDLIPTGINSHTRQYSYRVQRSVFHINLCLIKLKYHCIQMLHTNVVTVKLW